MTDRKLLELAAKAAGYDFTFCPEYEEGPKVAHVSERHKRYFRTWHPTISSADAADLAERTGQLAMGLYAEPARMEIFNRAVEIGRAM